MEHAPLTKKKKGVFPLNMLLHIPKKLNIIVENKPKQGNKALHCWQNTHSPIPPPRTDTLTSGHLPPPKKEQHL